MISAAPFDVGEYGYVEREFFASGEAHRYLKADGSVFGGGERQSAVPLVQGEIAGDYTTRVVVRQPSADIFNGTLVVEWTNVTTGQDGEFVFGESHDTLLTEGYAVAVVSAQKIGVDNLAATLPARYGDLEVEPEDCGAACPRDAMSWDIIAQVSKALRSAPSSPFAARGVEKMILTGQSQSAATTSAYYNLFHPSHQVFDGFVFWDGAVPLRTDISTPAVSLSSWTLNSGGPLAVTGNYTRRWEINGSAHGSAFVHEYMDAVFVRDGTQPNGQSFTDWHLGIGNCASRQVGTKVHVGQVIGAAIAAVDTWARGGQPAPASTFFQRNADGTLALDDRGFMIGGVQIADAAAPAWRYEHNTGGWTCPAAGAWAEYSAAELHEMYGSHAGYVAAVTEVTEAALAAGYILESDAEKTIAEAEESNVGATDSDDSQEIEVTVPGASAGEFVWSIDGSNSLVRLGDAVESGDHYEATGEMNPVRVTDTRAGSPQWSISASVSDFAAGSDSFSGKFLGWSPKLLESGTRVQSGAVVGSGFDGGAGLSVSSTLGFGQVGHDRASAVLGADLELKIPIEVGEGTYSATLTLTALS
ncbi:hypothetical protein GCM10009775_07820 [Microbacterium aoyamense]|uniref:Alpha/beta hydrolase domain-containing protein n=2 Tax=Microbacterium aoyamense TaxID=344166 RepID=A0ABN2PDF2_9MICO